MTAKTKSYLIAAGAGLTVAALVAYWRGLFRSVSPEAAYAALCDAFFVPGALMVCIGLLGFISYGGFYDIFGYSLYSLRRLLPFHREKKQPRYYDYRVMKAEKRHKPNYVVLKVGLVFLALAVIFLILSESAA